MAKRPPKWVHGSRVPEVWEGRDAWIWDSEGGLRFGQVPKGFSRDPHHVGDHHFMLIPRPKMPAGRTTL